MFLRIALVLSFLSLVLIPAASQPPKPKKYALLIGVNKYNHTELDKLQYAEADVTAAAEVFKAADYEVELLTGEKATRENIEKALKRLAKKGSEDGVVVVGLAGHGLQFEGETDAYFLAFDSAKHVVKKDGKNVSEWDPKTMVPLADVISHLSSSPAGAKLLLADCCRNDPKSGRGRGVGAGMKSSELSDNMAVMMSCSKGQRAWESDKFGGGHGAFFHHVLEGLGGKAANTKGQITADRLKEYIEDSVPESVTQIIKEGAEQRPVCLVNGRVELQLTKLVAKKPNPKGPPDGELVNEIKPGEERDFEIAEGVKMRFCWVPPGKATLGSPKDDKDRNDAEVEHEYVNKGFWLGKYEVTQAEWRAVMGKNPSLFASTGPDAERRDRVKGMNTDRFPVEWVSWDDCQEFLKKVNGRAGMKGRFQLPHEDEWEYACRGGLGNSRPFYFGSELNGTQANCDGNNPYGTTRKGAYKERPEPVGSYEGKARHPWGLCDMHGNVSEWCDNHLYIQVDHIRVIRGGSWCFGGQFCRAASRGGDSAVGRQSTYGCRILLFLD